MSATAIRVMGKATSERLLGLGPGRLRAFAAAMFTGTATAAVTYKLLRGDNPLSKD